MISFSFFRSGAILQSGKEVLPNLGDLFGLVSLQHLRLQVDLNFLNELLHLRRVMAVRVGKLLDEQGILKVEVIPRFWESLYPTRPAVPPARFGRGSPARHRPACIWRVRLWIYAVLPVPFCTP